ncbi:heme/copper-type cytochrome/quinol oxidase subunit 2 [Clostridium beijerinckii]|uniref:hypothetical protein n=1 Tax=Clostridium beijerinckii TaxID=1520 RepID=UPI001F4BEBD7|nr:hypothetical protein [Clostridium beijerinckii]NOW84949.1 heme/copper-type cytochrome/quinol oxidase subunit 2 [Clostridium beijerinckii]
MIIKKQAYNISKIVLVSIFLNLIQIIFITLFIYYKSQNPHMIEGNFIIYVVAISIGINSVITGIIFYPELFIDIVDSKKKLFFELLAISILNF